MTPPSSPPTTYAGLVDMAIGFVNILIPAMFALLFLVVVWKVIDAWVIHGDDPGKREEGQRFALTAVLVTVVAVCVWGIVALLRASFFGA